MRHLFDHRLLALRKARAAAGFAQNAFLYARVAQDFAERLAMVNRTFPRALSFGDGGLMRAALAPQPEKVGQLISAQWRPEMASQPGLACSPDRFPLAEGQLNLILAFMDLGAANDLVGVLIQLRRALAPDGLLLAALWGPHTLQELRECLIAAEAELAAGAALRIAPFADAADGAQLLQRAGLALPVADSEIISVRYRDPAKLIADLRAMGETAAFAERAPPLRRAIIQRAFALYRERFALPDGRLPATFEIVTLTGWAAHESQQKPLRPGSAKARLADALGAQEQSAGEKAGSSET